MLWHFAENGKQIGPITDEQLHEFFRSGRVTPETLVWREGLADWQPYAVAVQGSTPPPPTNTQCGVCRKGFAKDDMMYVSDTWLCATCKPVFVQAMKEGVNLGTAATVCRSGKLLVMGMASTLPERCVKCNAPAESKLVRKLRWHKPAWYFLVLINLLVYAVVAMAVSKKAKITVGLCARHRSQRITAIVVSWVLVVVAIGLFIFAAASETFVLVPIGIVMLLVGFIYGSAKGPVVRPTKIDKEHVWLKGVCKEYLAELPEWLGTI